MVRVGVVMGSISDWSVLEHASLILTEFGVLHETNIVSAHRTPDELASYAKEAAGRGLRCIIAGAGGAAHLPGMIAAHTVLPVLGVPVPSTALLGIDSLLSIVQMPGGVPVATFAIGKPGAINAALFALSILAIREPSPPNSGLTEALVKRRKREHDAALEAQASLPFPR